MTFPLKIAYVPEYDAEEIKYERDRGIRVISTLRNEEEILDRFSRVRGTAYDIDGTLTFLGNLDGSNYDVCWAEIEKTVDYKDEFTELARKWKSGEIDSGHWTAVGLQIYVDRKLPKSSMDRALGRIMLREGCREFLEIPRQYGMPVAAVSWGLAGTLRYKGIDHYFNEIRAWDLLFNEQGFMTGFTQGPTDLTKGQHLKEFAANYGLTAAEILTATDSEHDEGLQNDVALTLQVQHAGYAAARGNFSPKTERMWGIVEGLVIYSESLEEAAAIKRAGLEATRTK